METILTHRGRISPIHLTPAQARADALVSSFVDHATDGYSLAAMVGGGVVYRLGRVGTLALGSRLFGVGALREAPLLSSLVRYGSIGVGFTGEVFTFEAGQRALRVGIGRADPNLLRWSGENGLGRGLVGAAITLGSLKGTGAFVNGHNPVLQHLFQDSAMVLAHNVSGSIGITDRPRESLAEQMVNAEATLWQMNAGMALVHGAFPGLGQVERSLDLSVRSGVGAAPRGRPIFGGTHGEVPLHLTDQPLPATAGDVPIGARGSRRLPDQILAMVGDPPGGNGEPSPGDPREAETKLERRVPVRPPDAVEGEGVAEDRTDKDPTTPGISPQVPPEETGLHLGMILAERYKVLDYLGSGGFGHVIKIWDRGLERFAVIKVPRADRDTPETRARFENEVKINANLDPQRVVAVYDLVRLPDGRRVPVMEYVPGRDLSEVIRQSPPLPMTDLLGIFIKICEGVDAGHRKGIAHRDLKPANIRVTEDGHVKIMDWGLAKPFDEIGTEGVPEAALDLHVALQHDLTAAGTMFGTSGYIAPETFTGQYRRNRRTVDVFALGAILYQMVTGRQPFTDGKANENQRFHSTNPLFFVPPAPFRDLIAESERTDLHEKIEEIAQRALDQDPDRRFQSVRGMWEAALMIWSQAEFDRIQSMNGEMRELEGRMHRAWEEYRTDRTVTPEQEERMLEPLYLLKQRSVEVDHAAETLLRHLTQIATTHHAAEARRMIAELAFMRLEKGGDLMPRDVRRTQFDLIGEFDPEMKALLDRRLPVEIRASDPLSGQSLPAGLQARLIPIEEYRLGYYREGKPVLEGSLDNVTQIDLSPGYHVIEFAHPDYAFFRYPLQIRWSTLREGLSEGRALRLPLRLIPRRLLPPGFALVHGGEATIGHNIHRFDDPSFVISLPERRISFDSFAVGNLITVDQYRVFLEDRLQAINALIEQGRFEEASRQAEEVRHLIPRDQPTVSDRSIEGVSDWEGFLASAFEGIRYHWRIVGTGEGRGLRFQLVNPTTHRSLKDDPILADQPIHSIPQRAAERYAAWGYQRLQSRGYEGPPPRLPTATELEIVARNSFPWTFPWGYFFRRTFISSRLVHRDLVADTYAHPLGTHPLGPEYYRDYSLYQAVDENGRRMKIVDLLANVREWTSSSAEGIAVHQFGGSPRTPAGTFFLPAARTYFPREISDDLHGGFRLVIPYPPPSDRTP